jgi:hypothetical protein
LAVCAAIHHAADVWAVNYHPKLNRLLVHTDNTNTIDMFHSLHAKPSYNQLLISTINARMRSDLDVRVAHIPGEANVVADVVSHNNFALAHRLVPGLRILTLTPPRDALGAVSL